MGVDCPDVSKMINNTMAHQRILSSMLKKLEELAVMVAQPLLYYCMEHLKNTLTNK